MKMEALTPVELQIIQSMLVKRYGPASPFLEQLASARVSDRRMTDVGIFVDLLPAKSAYRVDEVNSEISKDFPTLLESPCDIIGFTLFIRRGYLSFLEGYTFGDVKWPGDALEKWLVFDIA